MTGFSLVASRHQHIAHTCACCPISNVHVISSEMQPGPPTRSFVCLGDFLDIDKNGTKSTVGTIALTIALTRYTVQTGQERRKSVTHCLASTHRLWPNLVSGGSEGIIRWHHSWHYDTWHMTTAHIPHVARQDTANILIIKWLYHTSAVNRDH